MSVQDTPEPSYASVFKVRERHNVAQCVCSVSVDSSSTGKRGRSGDLSLFGF